jgi:hypothetical protein
MTASAKAGEEFVRRNCHGLQVVLASGSTRQEAQTNNAKWSNYRSQYLGESNISEHLQFKKNSLEEL